MQGPLQEEDSIQSRQKWWADTTADEKSGRELTRSRSRRCLYTIDKQVEMAFLDRRDEGVQNLCLQYAFVALEESGKGGAADHSV